jgi:hypothetical protein
MLSYDRIGIIGISQEFKKFLLIHFYKSDIMNVVQDRIHRKIMDTVSNVAVMHGLPYQVHVLVYDSETRARYGSFVGVQYFGKVPGAAQVTRTGIGQLRDGLSARYVAEKMIKDYPGTPLICDKQIFQELEHGSFSCVSDDGHYRLDASDVGIIEVYVDYLTANAPKDELSPGIVSERVFLE